MTSRTRKFWGTGLAVALVAVTLALWLGLPSVSGEVNAPSGGGSGDTAEHAAVHAQQAEQSANQPGAQPQTVSDASGRTFAIPSVFQFAGVLDVPAAASLEELLAHYSESEQAQIIDFIALLPGAAYEFTTEAQLEWMAQAGFPMPGDILKAATMSLQTLDEQAFNGSVKASFLARHRRLKEQLEGAPFERGKEPILRMGNDERLGLMTGSPFFGYLEAFERRIAYPETPREAMVGPLLWASLKGDIRAARSSEVAGVQLSEGLDAYLYRLTVMEECLRRTHRQDLICPHDPARRSLFPQEDPPGS